MEWPTFHSNVHRDGVYRNYIVTGVEDDAVEPITEAALEQNYPNPFNPMTSIVFYLPDGAARPVSLVVYNVLGQRLRTLMDGLLPGGRHVRVWDGRDERGNRVGTGIYFYQLRQPGFTTTKKMLLLK